MPQSLSALKQVNDTVTAELAGWYERYGAFLSKNGNKIVERALSKGTVAGHKTVLLLFEPAFLIGLNASPDSLYDLAVICQQIPFTGNYALFEPVAGIHAMAYRSLRMADDPRAAEIEQWLSYAENGGQTGAPVIDTAMTNRLNGLSIERSLEHELSAPLTLAWFSFLIGRVRILMIMWAFGGSAMWPRTRIDQELQNCEVLIADFVDGPICGYDIEQR